MRRSSCLSSILACALVLGAASANAQQPASDSAAQEAQSLFNDALSLFDKGSYKAALEGFVDVNKKYPSVGALYKIGECYEKLGKPVAAWEYFTKSADTAHTKNDTAREKGARDKAASLEAKLPKITVASPADGLEVRVNGLVIPQDRWNKPLLQGPGKKDIVARAPGMVTSTTQVTVSEEGQPAEIAIPTLEVEPDPGKTLKLVGLVTIGVGVVGVGVGAVTGLMAGGKKSDAEKERDACIRANQPAPCAGMETAKDSASSLATVSTIGFIAGGVLVAGGFVLYMIAPKRSTEPTPAEPPKTAKPFQLRDVSLVPVTGPNDTGFVLSGRW